MNFKARLQRAFPVWRQLLKRSTPFVRQQFVTGGTAGKIAVSNIKKNDQLVSVLSQDDSTYALSEVTSQFVANTNSGQLIVEDGYIDNTGGSSTASTHLLVTWLAWGE